MHELDSISVQGFRSLAAVEDLKLGAINVVIGPNGSGKSNLIDVFSFLHAIREGRLQEYVARAGGADRLLHFGTKTTPELKIHISFKNEVNQYRIVLVPTAEDALYPISETVYYWNKLRYDRPWEDSLLPRGMEGGISDPRLQDTPDWIRRRLDRWRVYHFHDTSAGSPMKKTADLNDNRILRPDASNLAPYLYFLREKHESAYSLIRRTVQRMAPFFDDFVLEPQRLNEEKIRLEWRHKNSEAYFDAASLSDGTLRFIALSTLFLQPEEYRPSIILVDEPELGLHPYAIGLLASLVKQASVKTQVVVSTQSPLLLDYFDPEDVLVAERSEGRTQFSRLEPESLENWLEEYSLGQLWEKNELGGRPRAEMSRG
jgi:predicted ATPase